MAFAQSHMLRNTHFKAASYMLLAEIAYVGMAVSLKYGVNREAQLGFTPSFGTWEAVFSRSLLMIVVSGLIITLQSRWSFFRSDRRELLLISSRSFLGAANMAVISYATLHVPLVIFSSFLYLKTIFSMLFSLAFLNEQIRKSDALCVAICFLGVGLTFADGASHSSGQTLGYLAALLAGIVWGYVNFMSRYFRHVHWSIFMFLFGVFGLLLCLFQMMFTGFHLPNDVGGFTSLVIFGILGVLSQLLMTKSLAFAPISTTASVQFANVLFAGTVGILFFNETLSATEICGLLLIAVCSCFLPLFRAWTNARRTIEKSGIETLTSSP